MVVLRVKPLGFVAAILGLLAGAASAQTFVLPTANTNLFNRGSEAEFFAPTANPSIEPEWMSGAYGCVRNSGARIHEGIDIRSIARDRNQEPVDDVFAIADGQVLYVNSVAGNSTYGRYIVMGHRIEGMDILSVYAHLREIGEGVRSGLTVRQGQRIGVLGRSSNTRAGISKERAHLHLEIGLFMNTRFSEWYQKEIPGARNDHGMFNGLNMTGLDPRRLYLDQQARGELFSLARFIRSQPELCRVQVRDTDFEFARRYRPLIDARHDIQAAEFVGYEVVLNFAGTPIRLIPRTEGEMESRQKIHLVSVNEGEAERNRCRGLVRRSGSGWELQTNGRRVIGLMLH